MFAEACRQLAISVPAGSDVGAVLAGTADIPDRICLAVDRWLDA